MRAAALWLLAIPLAGQIPVPLPSQPNNGLGESDLDVIPGQKWRIHDLNRPRPTAITPGARPGEPPSDALILFDGKDLSHWQPFRMGTAPDAPDATWKVRDGYVEVVPGGVSLATKERFRDIQLHLEWAAPDLVNDKAQYRGNSGIMLLGRYEIQLLDSYENPTYADGQLGAIYGQWPPPVNPARKPGEWQSFDIVFEAPKYESDKMIKAPDVTVFLNGVLLHHHQEILTNLRMGGRRGAGANAAGAGGPSPQGGRGLFSGPPPAEGPIVLQGHPSVVAGAAPRFRNIWVRRLPPYDQPAR